MNSSTEKKCCPKCDDDGFKCFDPICECHQEGREVTGGYLLCSCGHVLQTLEQADEHRGRGHIVPDHQEGKSESWEAEFDAQFTENGNGWSAPNIYRDGGAHIIKELKQFIHTIERAAVENCIAVVIDSGLPSNEQMTTVRALRKLIQSPIEE